MFYCMDESLVFIHLSIEEHLSSLSVLVIFFLIELELISKIVLVSGVEQSYSVIYVYMSETLSCSVISDSLQPHGAR